MIKTALRLTLFAGLAVTLSAGSASAEHPFHGAHGPQGMHGDMEPSPEMKARLKEMRGKMLRERVGLDDARAKKVEAMMEASHAQGRKLHEDVRDNHQALKELLAQDSNDDGAYQASLGALLSARRQLRVLHDTHMSELQKILTPKEQAKMVIAMHAIKRHMGKKHRGHGHGHKKGMHGPRGDGGPAKIQRGE